MSAAAGPFAGSPEEWDAFVAAHEGATHCHLWAWKRVIEEAYGHPCPYLCVRGPGGTLTGVLPLARVRSRLVGTHLVSLPYLNAGGPLGDEASVRRLTDRAAALARTDRTDVLELRCTRAMETGLPRVDEKVACVLDLPPEGPDALWRAFPSKLRSQVRRPQKAGATMHFGPEQGDDFYRVFARNMRDLGTPPHSRAFFAAALRELGPRAWVGCVRMGGRAVAAGFAVRHGGAVEMVWASAVREASADAPNMLLYWEFLRRAAQEGVDRFDFGRCTPGGGTHRFKRQWGARDVPLPWYRVERPGGRAAPSQERGAAGLGSRLWRRLPVPVANLVGPRLRAALPA